MTINLHFTPRKNIGKKTQTNKIHDRQIPIYWKVPGSIKKQRLCEITIGRIQ